MSAKAYPNIVCFLTDRLHLGYLGAYGNSWIGTPAFDRLASESVLFDRAFAASLSLPALTRAFWTGEDPSKTRLDPPTARRRAGLLDRLFGKGEPTSSSPLFDALSAAGYRTVLLTDESEVAEFGRSFFDRIEFVSPATKIAEIPEQSQFYRGMTDAGALTSRLGRADVPFFLWIHFKGWNGVWDTPLSMRDRAREDDADPSPYDGASPPSFDMAREGDDDALRAAVEAYAAGIRLWDASLELFLDKLAEENLFARTALFLGGARGLSLGEDRRVGVEGPGTLYVEEIHVPLLYRPAGGPSEAIRSFGLCGPCDLHRTLARLAGGEPDEKTLLDLAAEEVDSIRDELTVTQTDASSPRQGVITDEWFFLRDRHFTPPRRELYLAPDDRWNVNEVADRGGEEILEQLERKIGRGGFA